MMQEVQVVMDAKVNSMNEDLAEHKKSLQVCCAYIDLSVSGWNEDSMLLMLSGYQCLYSSSKIESICMLQDLTFQSRVCVSSPCPCLF